MSSFEGARFLDLCEQYRITWALLYTPQMSPIVNSPAISVKKLQSLRQLLFVGACAQVLVLQKLQSHLPKGAVLQLLYGMTELGSSVANNNSVQLRPSSVGELYANIRMRVVDDKGNLLGLNSTGELYCHTGDTWRGYFNDPTSSAQLQDSKGWIHTGDLGYFDDNNQLYIVGRKKEMLRYNGFMYYPQEIEQVILQMTEVAEVCVFGIWLETTEDAAAAIVCAQPNSKLTSAQVVDFVREHIRVEYKQLNAGVLIVDRIPRAQNGKVQRTEAKKIFLKEMCKNESDSEFKDTFMSSGLTAGLTPQG
ncbi:probable 4-coumarate--CoA ligase 1 [Drosophila busckii]|nr:probable 4-coumarate--CoA ligase 1 [Drosophila busckii]